MFVNQCDVKYLSIIIIFEDTITNGAVVQRIEYDILKETRSFIY